MSAWKVSAADRPLATHNRNVEEVRVRPRVRTGLNLETLEVAVRASHGRREPVLGVGSGDRGDVMPVPMRASLDLPV